MNNRRRIHRKLRSERFGPAKTYNLSGTKNVRSRCSGPTRRYLHPPHRDASVVIRCNIHISILRTFHIGSRGSIMNCCYIVLRQGVARDELDRTGQRPYSEEICL